jgi:membrane protein implicated in regulation of membrane protease activity
MLIFFSIAAASFVILCFSFLFGHDHDFDHDADHAVEGGEGGTISIFSSKVILTLLMGFGAAGGVARYYDAAYPLASGVGVLTGVALAAVMYGFLALIARQQASSAVSVTALVGSDGVVTVSIGGDQAGEVGVSFAGQYAAYPARSHKGTPIPKGRSVRVVQVTAGQLIVEET